MCQGKMLIRAKFEKSTAPNKQHMLDNFDKALSHPDQNDINTLIKDIQK